MEGEVVLDYALLDVHHHELRDRDLRLARLAVNVKSTGSSPLKA